MKIYDCCGEEILIEQDGCDIKISYNDPFSPCFIFSKSNAKVLARQLIKLSKYDESEEEDENH